MLINFCRKSLGSSAICSTVSNDGYEVTNLTSDSDRGFLAYSCIKPPIHVDFTFVCDIRINHVLIWPTVGAQRSSGFEISIKSGNEYKRLSTGFLSSAQSGLLFYRRDIDQSSVVAPPNFLQRYMQLSREQGINRARTLRISILRTENSVPAIGRVEIWGRVSNFSGKEAIERVQGLWQCSNEQRPKVEAINGTPGSNNVAETLRDSIEETTSVPDCFLDPITWNIMIQPIVLPSGAIIDQSTLEKYGKTEATWGRTLSDPFTGLPLNDSRKPIIASALKARIDRYLLENKDKPDVMRLPRLSGHKQIVMSMRNRSLEISECTAGIETVPSVSSRETFKIEKSTNNSEEIIKIAIPHDSHAKIQRLTRTHRLPIIPLLCSKRGAANKIGGSRPARMKSFGISAYRNETRASKGHEIEESNSNYVNPISSNFEPIDADDRTKTRVCLKNCECISKIFYKFPCGHVLCRDVLMAVEDSRCSDCSAKFNSRDLERVHGHLGFG